MNMRTLNAEESKKLAQWRIASIEIAPLMAPILFGLRFASVGDDITDTMSASWSRYTVLINFDGMDDVYGEDFPVKVGAWNLLHVASHFLLDHHDRQIAIDPFNEHTAKFELAAELDINPMIYELSGLRLETAIFPEDLELRSHLGVETFYRILPDPPGIDIMGGSAPGSVKDWESPSSQSESDGEDSEGDGSCGSCAGGAENEDLNEEIDRTLGKGSRGGFEAAEKASRQEGKNIGVLPQDVLDVIKAVTEPKVQWREVLRNQVAGASSRVLGSDIPDFRRTNRRWSSNEGDPRIMIPGRKSSLLRITLVRDQSGSMTDDDLAEVNAEIISILTSIGPSRVSLTVMDWDVKDHGLFEATLGDYEKLSMRTAMGGTDMGAALVKIGETPGDGQDVVIVATDGHTDWPYAQNPVRCPVIVCLIGKQSRSVASVPVWASAVKVDD
jgi:predicted metal-dependent peptidase